MASDTNRIYRATAADYGRFEASTFNRAIRRNNSPLIDSMKKYGYLLTKPIVVRKHGARQFVIVEGHHRFAAASELGIPFYYIIESSDITVDVVESTVTAWTTRDFVHAYASSGDESYIALLKFHEWSKIALTMCARMLGAVGSTDAKKLRTGTWRANEDTEVAFSVASIMSTIRKYNKRIGSNTHCVGAALDLCLMPGFSVRRMIKKIDTFAGKLVPQADTESYVTMLEGIYNYFDREPLNLAGPALAAAKNRRNNGNSRATKDKAGK